VTVAEVAIVPAGHDHIATIAARMRQADVAEVWAASRSTPHRARMFSLQHSQQAWTALVDGQPEVMFGVADLNILTATGAPWLLGTDAVIAHRRQFLRRSVWWREKLLGRYEVLTNFVHDGNVVSKRWLGWLGFTLHDPAPTGVSGEMFRLFELRR
jgi:hypothetical protein